MRFFISDIRDTDSRLAMQWRVFILAYFYSHLDNLYFVFVKLHALKNILNIFSSIFHDLFAFV